MHNLLTDPVIRFDKTGGKRAEASLAEVYALLMADEVDAFPALRPHQRHAWHAFLAQLGAMSMHQAGMIEPPAGASQWTALLRGPHSGLPRRRTLASGGGRHHKASLHAAARPFHGTRGGL